MLSPRNESAFGNINVVKLFLYSAVSKEFLHSFVLSSDVGEFTFQGVEWSWSL